jgi:hypothetical protein
MLNDRHSIIGEKFVFPTIQPFHFLASLELERQSPSKDCHTSLSLAISGIVG